MATDIYTLHVAYKGLENRIWRDVDASGNYPLNYLGYAILATFDTMAYHLFEFSIYDVAHQIPHEEFTEDDFDMARFRLCDFQFKVGNTFTMDYDFGTTQTFLFTVIGIRPLEDEFVKRFYEFSLNYFQKSKNPRLSLFYKGCEAPYLKAFSHFRKSLRLR